MRRLKTFMLLVAGLLVLLVQSSPSAAASSTEKFTFSWKVSPAAPQPWNPDDWDVVVHSRDTQTWGQLEPMQAQHGADCSPYPATHLVSTYEDSVFLCKNHMMTAIDVHLMASLANGGLAEYVPWTDHVFTEPIRLREGMIYAPQGPGLGVELKPDALQRFAI